MGASRWDRALVNGAARRLRPLGFDHLREADVDLRKRCQFINRRWPVSFEFVTR